MMNQRIDVNETHRMAIYDSLTPGVNTIKDGRQSYLTVNQPALQLSFGLVVAECCIHMEEDCGPQSKNISFPEF